MTTRTGNFKIGFRRGWSDWQKKDPAALCRWTKESGFAALDLMNIKPADLTQLKEFGLAIGSVDLLDFGNLLASDSGKRAETIAKNVAYIQELSAAGAKVFFTCVLPGEASKPRAENYKLAVESFQPIAEAAQKAGAKIAVEGWPGGHPNYASLCCTPETYRAFMKDLGPSVGVNYDPSHLIRLGVDHIRFLKAFAPNVYHVHAKDTELIPEAVYEYGLYQPSAFSKSHGFGEQVWRYTLPGHGCARWTESFSILKSAGYSGCVSVELEDENFNGSESGEKAGLLASLAFLKSA